MFWVKLGRPNVSALKLGDGVIGLWGGHGCRDLFAVRCVNWVLLGSMLGLCGLVLVVDQANP
jgi:hypothetical protein